MYVCMDCASWRKLQASGWAGGNFDPCWFIQDTLKQNSEVCQPRCAFKLYGKVNSVKKTQL